MDSLLEISIIVFLIVIQSIFGVGLLLFGTPSFLIMGYDFPNTINILMPVSITISFLQFSRSNVSDKKFIKEYDQYKKTYNEVQDKVLKVCLFPILNQSV